MNYKLISAPFDRGPRQFVINVDLYNDINNIYIASKNIRHWIERERNSYIFQAPHMRSDLVAKLWLVLSESVSNSQNDIIKFFDLYSDLTNVVDDIVIDVNPKFLIDVLEACLDYSKRRVHIRVNIIEDDITKEYLLRSIQGVASLRFRPGFELIKIFRNPSSCLLAKALSIPEVSLFTRLDCFLINVGGNLCLNWRGVNYENLDALTVDVMSARYAR